jgi:site-specific recombinase XerD
MKQLVEQLVFNLALWSSRWLKSHSQKKWLKLSSDIEKNRVHTLGRNISSVYKADNEIGLKSLVSKGFPGDLRRHEKDVVSLPRWAREIPTFLANQLSDHTRRSYETDLKQFFQFLEGRISSREIESLRPDHVILFRKYLEEGRLNGKIMEKSTVNRKLAVVKSFLNWLKVNQVIRDNPAQLVKGFPQSQESSLNGLSDDEARKILNLPNRNSRAGALHLAVLHVLLYLGLRKSELLNLKMGDLTEERGVTVLKVRGKGHRVRILPLTSQLKNILEHYFFACRRDKTRPEDPMFTPTKNPATGELLKKMHPHAITYIVMHYAKKGGILKKISPHSCRATCISNALDRKATQRSVQHLAGWSTPLMIQRYDKRREDLKNSAAFLVDYGVEEPVATSAGL